MITNFTAYVHLITAAAQPHLYLCGFLTPPVEGALFRAALVASCFLGAFPPVDLRAVCFVRAIVSQSLELKIKHTVKYVIHPNLMGNSKR